IVRKQRNLTGNDRALDRSFNLGPINECIVALVVAAIEDRTNRVATRCIGNLELRRDAQFEFKNELFSVDAWWLVGKQIRNAARPTGEHEDREEGPALSNEKPGRVSSSNENGRDNSNDEPRQNPDRPAHEHNEHAAPAFHVRHVPEFRQVIAYEKCKNAS